MPQETNEIFRDVAPAPLSSAIGEFWSLTTTSAQLGVPERDLLALVDRHEVLQVITADEQRLFPAFQFSDRRVMPALVPVLQTLLATTDGWEVTTWLQTPLRKLAHAAPMDLLRGDDGDLHAQVVRLAQRQAALWQKHGNQ